MIPAIIGETEEIVADARESLGPDRDLMLDCYGVESDQDFIVRLAERLRPYRLKWVEDYLLPEDLQSYRSVRKRLPWQTLASGERWYMLAPFSAAAAMHLGRHPAARHPLRRRHDRRSQNMPPRRGGRDTGHAPSSRRRLLRPAPRLRYARCHLGRVPHHHRPR